MWDSQSSTYTCKVTLLLPRTCNDAGKSELDRNPPVSPSKPEETKIAQGLIKNMTSYVPGIDLLNLDRPEIFVMCKGKSMWA